MDSNFSMQFNWPLIGHDNIKDYFSRALGSRGVQHAYLFEGPAQVGKSTFARMLAKTLMCEKYGDSPSDPAGESSTAVPCNNCRACKAYEHGAHPDLVVFGRNDKGAISIDNVRDHIAELRTKPLLSAYRIGIIEDAGDLTIEAANALLKTLEEPAKQCVLILTASNHYTIPTIRSRCQIIYFRCIADEIIGAAVQTHPDSADIIRIANGRPGMAVAMRDPAVYQEYSKNMAELSEIIEQNEHKRMLWLSARLDGCRNASEKKKELHQILKQFEYILRGNMLGAAGVYGASRYGQAEDSIYGFSKRSGSLKIAGMLGRCAKVRDALEANVEPKRLGEYLMLTHDVYIP